MPRVGGDATVLEGRHVIHAGIHKGTVVGDYQHGAVVGGDEAAQPLDTFEVEVVGGLVEQQDVGMAEEQLGQRDTHLPATGELGTRLIEIRGLKTQTGKNLTRVALEFVATQTLEAVLHMTILVKHSLGNLAGLSSLGNLELKLLGALPHRLDFNRSVHNLLDDGGITGKFGLLLEIADIGILGKRNGPRIGAVDAHDDLEQRRLAGTVGTDKGVPLAGIHLERGTREQGPRAERLLDFVDKENHVTLTRSLSLYSKKAPGTWSL